MYIVDTWKNEIYNVAINVHLWKHYIPMNEIYDRHSEMHLTNELIKITFKSQIYFQSIL